MPEISGANVYSYLSNVFYCIYIYTYIYAMQNPPCNFIQNPEGHHKYVYVYVYIYI